MRRHTLGVRQFFDTQIVVDAFASGDFSALKEGTISSTVANEFLLRYDERLRDMRYHVPLPHRHFVGVHGAVSIASPLVLRRDHAFRKTHMDRLVLDTRGALPIIEDFGNVAVSVLLSRRDLKYLEYVTSPLEKRLQRDVRKRAAFLMHAEVECISISSTTVEIALGLLEMFLARYTLKTQIRNSINDLMIAAAAQEHEALLHTRDELLMRFVAESTTGLEPSTSTDGRLDLDFSGATSSKPILKRTDSKGYVNRGWSYRLKRMR